MISGRFMIVCVRVIVSVIVIFDGVRVSISVRFTIAGIRVIIRVRVRIRVRDVGVSSHGSGIVMCSVSVMCMRACVIVSDSSIVSGMVIIMSYNYIAHVGVTSIVMSAEVRVMLRGRVMIVGCWVRVRVRVIFRVTIVICVVRVRVSVSARCVTIVSVMNAVGMVIRRVMNAGASVRGRVIGIVIFVCRAIRMTRVRVRVSVGIMVRVSVRVSVGVSVRVIVSVIAMFRVMVMCDGFMVHVIVMNGGGMVSVCGIVIVMVTVSGRALVIG